MRSICILLASAICCLAQADRRIERAKGYHIISRPERKGETPPEVIREKAEDDRRRGQNDPDISKQSIPTRDPELKPKDSKP